MDTDFFLFLLFKGNECFQLKRSLDIALLLLLLPLPSHFVFVKLLDDLVLEKVASIIIYPV